MPILQEKENDDYFDESEYEEKSISEQFNEFYKIINGVSPTNEMMDLFLEIAEGSDRG